MFRYQRFEYIDALRGWAILGVLLVHVWIWVGANNPILNLVASKGANGVQLFYLISAYTLLLSYHRKKDEGSFRWGDYFVRRFFRIAPLFYVAMCLYGPMWHMVPRYWMPEGIEFWHILSTLTFTHGWHPMSVNAIVPGGWSMSVEVTFYLLFPLFCLTVTNLKRALIFTLMTLLAALALSHWAFEHYLDLVPERFSYVIHNFAYVYIPGAQICVFALGFVSYYLMQRQAFIIKKSYLLVAGFITLAIWLFWLPPELPAYFSFSLAFVLLLIGFSGVRHWLFVNPLITTIGKLSYSLYLVHFGVIFLLKTYLKDYFIFENKDITLLVVFTLVLLISMLISSVSYRFIEKPGIELGKFVSQKL